MIAGDVHTRFRRWSVAETGRLPRWLWRAWMRWSICEDNLHLTSHRFIFYRAAWPCMKESCRVTQGRCASQIYGTVGNCPAFLSGPAAHVKRWYVGAYCQSQYRRDFNAVASTWDIFGCESGQLGIKHMLGHHCGAQTLAVRSDGGVLGASVD